MRKIGFLYRTCAGQDRNQGGRIPPRKIFAPLEKCVGHILKLLETGQKFEPLSENSSPLLVSQAGYGPGYNLI